MDEAFLPARSNSGQRRNSLRTTFSKTATVNTGPRSKKAFRCLDRNCDTKPFGSRSDLKRHQREVHHRDEDGNPCLLLPCPVFRCERHEKGFPRRWNLEDHVRRMHPDYKSQTLFNEPSSIDEFREIDDRPHRRGSPDSSYSSDSTSTEGSSHGSRDSSCEGLRMALSILEKQREKMDQEISRMRSSIAQNEKRKNSK